MRLTSSWMLRTMKGDSRLPWRSAPCAVQQRLQQVRVQLALIPLPLRWGKTASLMRSATFKVQQGLQQVGMSGAAELLATEAL